MKVKFTKTIDIGDIPAESRKMLDLTKNSILYSLPNVISEVVRYSLSSDGQEFFHSISLIESLREDLRGIDTQLAEVQEIMQGYRDYLVKVAEENENSAREKNREKNRERMENDSKIREEIEAYVEDHRIESDDEEWMQQEQAETERREKIAMDVGEVEDEEG